MEEGYIISIEKVEYFVDVQSTLAHMPSTIKDINITDTNYIYDFIGRLVDDESFKFGIWKKYIKRALQEKEALMSYGDLLGESVLKRALQKYS